MLFRNIMVFPQKIRESPYDLAIPPLSIYPKELKAGTQKGLFISMLVAALFTIAKSENNQNAHQQKNR